MTLRVNEQLTAYYRLHGLEGEELAKAVEYDYLMAIKELRALNPEHEWGSKFDNNTDLGGLFVWSRSDKGHRYWEERCHG